MTQSSRPPESKSSTYMAQIDALRVLAVLMVLVHHWSPQYSLFWFNAEMGVQLFFVISGYLITGILLDARTKAEALCLPRGRVLRRFYLRRFLRIFPVYYLLLAVTWLAGVETVRDSIGWHLAYLSNVFFGLQGSWHGHVTHFWSLSVEEQFYLAWPWLMLFLPRRALLPAVVAAILSAPTFRVLGAALFHLNAIALDVAPFSSLDTLGMGALLAMLERHPLISARLRGIVVGAGVTAAALYVGIRLFEGSMIATEVAEPLRRQVLPLALGALVFSAAKGIPGPVGRFFTLSPFGYLGKISYGLYLFHNFMQLLLWQVCVWIGVPFDLIDGTPWALGAKALLLVMCASLSWTFFEKPINDQKRHFGYV